MFGKGYIPSGMVIRLHTIRHGYKITYHQVSSVILLCMYPGGRVLQATTIRHILSITTLLYLADGV
jgi:hypothetical protein